MSKVKFDLDWDSLFPGKVFKVETMTHHVKPLNIKGIASITKQIKEITPVLKDAGIDIGNLEKMEEKNVIEIVTKAIPILMETAPKIISEATGIEIESLVRFPPQYLIELVTVAVQANIESKQALEKNFKCLANLFRKKETQKED